eukprot:m.486276 g.486276  ORF g.486276 m.486276 type:complete len:83 (+) comp77185_c0_seq1:118-366(+)
MNHENSDIPSQLTTEWLSEAGSPRKMKCVSSAVHAQCTLYRVAARGAADSTPGRYLSRFGITIASTATCCNSKVLPRQFRNQ